jgi:hypothetical protein
MDDVDKCASCWRNGSERDGCNCVLELTPPAHPEHGSTSLTCLCTGLTGSRLCSKHRAS